MANSHRRQKSTLSTWQVIQRVIHYRLWFYLGYLLIKIITELLRQVPPLAMREFFDLLTKDAQVGLGIWSLAALLIATEVGDYIACFGINATMIPFNIHIVTLLRKNLLQRVLERPGASALPDSPGEAISRFRGDAFEIPQYTIWLAHLLTTLFSGAIALVVMLHINPIITLLAILPCLVIGLLTSAGRRRGGGCWSRCPYTTCGWFIAGSPSDIAGC